MDQTGDFSARMAAAAAAVEDVLAGLLSDDVRAGEIARPDRLMAAMRHGVLGGGKRLRPFLLIETANLFQAEGDGVLRAAAALECIHCYSLVHDDLPAMDNDDLRRGRPTVHKAFNEWTGILAGDALLTLAFEVMIDPLTAPDAYVRAALVAGLARAAGIGGMVGGQMLDIAAEKDMGPALKEAEIRRLQEMKTGALIAYALDAGALLGGAETSERAALQQYGRAIGLAFQLADDLLDVEGDAAQLGKATAKDAALGKATLVSLYGVERTRAMLGELKDEAIAALDSFGERAEILRQAARFIIDRER